LLSFLLGERYKESVNKPTLVKPQSVSTGTSTESAVPVASVESAVEPQQNLASQFLGGLRTGLEKEESRSLASSRRASIDSVASYATSDPTMGEAVTPVVAAVAGGGAPVVERTREELKLALQRRRAAKGLPLPAHTQSVLEQIKEEKAAEEGAINVDFR
jgi:hypothetical protein